MKKFIALFLLLASLASFASCGCQQESDGTNNSNNGNGNNVGIPEYNPDSPLIPVFP